MVSPLPWMVLTLVFLGVTVTAFFWAVGALRGGAPSAKKMRRKGAPPAPARERQADLGSYGGTERPRGGAPAPGEAALARGPNALAWATFGISAFGTLSSFVLSLLTYLRAS